MSAEVDFEDFTSQDGLCARDSSMKTLMMRVSAVNHTGENKDDVVEYTLEWLVDTFVEWNKTFPMNYFIIAHTPDDGDPNLHFHVVASFFSPTHFSVVKNKFPFGNIQTAKSIRKAVQYLVHANHPEKVQYSWSDIVTNVTDLTAYQVKTRTQLAVSLQYVFNGIEKGEITPYNYQYTIPMDVYSQNERVIQAAFKHHSDSVTSNIHRPIKVIYIYGSSGIGKSRLAYDLAKSLYPDEEPALASAERDPLQDYKGQHVLIWGEFRSSHMKYSDLISFIDPHYRSSGSSRYRNKHFEGDLIIMASTQPLSTVYQGVQTSDNHRELRRRVQEYYQFVDDRVQVSFYDIRSNSYVQKYQFKNPYYGDTEDTLTKISESFDASVFERMGIKLEPAVYDWRLSDDGVKWEVNKRLYRERSQNADSVPDSGLGLFVGR